MDFNFDPDKTGIKVDVKRYMEVMRKRREQASRLVKKRKKVESETQYIRKRRRHPNEKMFRVGDLVFLDFELGALLKAPSKKLKRNDFTEAIQLLSRKILMVNPNFKAEYNSALINQFMSGLHDDIMQSLA